MIVSATQTNNTNTFFSFKGFYDPAAGAHRTAMQERLIQEAKEKAKHVLPDPNNIMHTSKDAFEHILPDGSAVTISLEDLSKKSSQLLSESGELLKAPVDKIVSAVAEHTDPSGIAAITHILPDGMTTIDVVLEHADNASEDIISSVAQKAFSPLKGDSVLEKIIRGVTDGESAEGVGEILDAVV